MKMKNKAAGQSKGLEEKKERRTGNFGLSCDIYDFNLNVVYGLDAHSFADFVREFNPDFDTYKLSSANAAVVDDGMGCYYLWVHDPLDTKILVHEVYHLVRMICRVKDLQWVIEDEESTAYYLAYWFGKINTELMMRLNTPLKS